MSDKTTKYLLLFFTACFVSTFYWGGNAFFFLDEEKLRYFRWFAAIASFLLFYIWIVKVDSGIERSLIIVDGVKYFADVYDELADMGVSSEDIRFFLSDGEHKTSGGRTRVKGFLPDGSMMIVIINKDGVIEAITG